MTAWRMAFRCGDRGYEMWPKCRKLGAAAITYRPLAKIDLSKYPQGEPKRLWAKLSSSQKASLRRVAYEMKAGDVIYVKQGPKIVGRGVVQGSYRFGSSRLIDPYGDHWAHQVPVKWESDFPSVEILLGAEPLTVKKLSATEVRKIETARRRVNKSNRQVSGKREFRSLASSSINYWWVTASECSEHPWHWERFFQNPGNRDEAYDWGGPHWIKSRISFARIKEMRQGDIVVAYQADEGVAGLAYLASDGYQHAKSRNYDTFDLKSSPVVWLDNPVPYSKVRALPKAKKHIEFVRAKRGTVFGVDSVGFKMILDLILKFNPSQRGEIQDFLSAKHPIPEAQPVAIDETGKQKLPPRTTSTTQRIVRDSAIGRDLKQLYQYRCQVCGQTIELPDGKRYAEVHHLRPVGKPHNGKDGFPNTIVVCPQHHAMFDLGAIAIEPKSYLIKHWDKDEGKKISRLILNHDLDSVCVQYHHRKIFKGGSK